MDVHRHVWHMLHPLQERCSENSLRVAGVAPVQSCATLFITGTNKPSSPGMTVFWKFTFWRASSSDLSSLKDHEGLELYFVPLYFTKEFLSCDHSCNYYVIFIKVYLRLFLLTKSCEDISMEEVCPKQRSIFPKISRTLATVLHLGKPFAAVLHLAAMHCPANWIFRLPHFGKPGVPTPRKPAPWGGGGSEDTHDTHTHTRTKTARTHTKQRLNRPIPGENC